MDVTPFSYVFVFLLKIFYVDISFFFYSYVGISNSYNQKEILGNQNLPLFLGRVHFIECNTHFFGLYI